MGPLRTQSLLDYLSRGLAEVYESAIKNEKKNSAFRYKKMTE